MHNMRDYSNIAHSDAWSKHLKKVRQCPENVPLPDSVKQQSHQNQTISRPSKWGKQV